jgi:hypothetical protein
MTYGKLNGSSTCLKKQAADEKIKCCRGRDFETSAVFLNFQSHCFFDFSNPQLFLKLFKSLYSFC